MTQIYFLCVKNLKNECLKPIFSYKITFWICVLVLWIHICFCVFKKLVWNFRFKAFLYTIYIFDSDLFFICQKFLKPTFKPVFLVQNHPLHLCIVLWIHRGYFLVWKLVWYVCIEAFWFTKIISLIFGFFLRVFYSMNARK